MNLPEGAGNVEPGGGHAPPPHNLQSEPAQEVVLLGLSPSQAGMMRRLIRKVTLLGYPVSPVP